MPSSTLLHSSDHCLWSSNRRGVRGVLHSMVVGQPYSPRHGAAARTTWCPWCSSPRPWTPPPASSTPSPPLWPPPGSGGGRAHAGVSAHAAAAESTQGRCRHATRTMVRIAAWHRRPCVCRTRPCTWAPAKEQDSARVRLTALRARPLLCTPIPPRGCVSCARRASLSTPCGRPSFAVRREKGRKLRHKGGGSAGHSWARFAKTLPSVGLCLLADAA